MVRAIWEAQGVVEENIKKATLVSVLEDRTLTWYIKHSNYHPNAGIANIQAVLNGEFNRPKSETQSIIRFKEIAMLPSETPWDLDQKLKSMIREANMTLTDGQHCTWFVASLTPHLRTALLQQKLSTQAKDLEIAMRLHESPIQDPSLRVQQIHAQLQNLSLEMQSLKQDRTARPEAHEEVWCIRCKGQGHDKDHFPVSANYLARGGPMPLRPEAQAGRARHVHYRARSVR